MDTSEVYVGGDGIIYDKLVGDVTPVTAEENIGMLKELAQKQKEAGQPVKILLDITGIGKQDVATRRSALDSIKGLDYTKLAVVGNGTFTKHLIMMVIRAAGRESNTNYFDGKEEAVSWLEN